MGSSTPVASSYSMEWDRPLTDQELEAIDAAFLSAASSTPSSSSAPPIKRRHVSPDPTNSHEHHRPVTRRRWLPHSVSDQFSLSPCSRNRFHNFRPRAELLLRYPTLTFRGHIVYSTTADEVDKSAKELIEFVENKKTEEGGKVVLGFDIEWKPTFRRGVPPGKAAVMQICGDINCCYVMHIIHSGIPQSLQFLLEDHSSIKVGVSIANDAYKMLNDYNVSVKTLEDLSGLANQKIDGNSKRWSLASLAETVICKQLPKPEKIRLGNWETQILSKEQIEYAAIDAFASWYLYQALKSLPEANDKCESRS